MNRVAVLIALICAACTASHRTLGEWDAGAPDAAYVHCGPGDDLDQDSISTDDEGLGDADSDGIPNRLDLDSDGDLATDAYEAGDDDCFTRPIDRDLDGVPDFLDRDGNGDGVDDAQQLDVDTDHDGIFDRDDDDVDGDHIPNVIEIGPSVATPRDTDGDSIPDVFDLDSDDDTIPDAVEGSTDADHDGLGNYIDTDSDGDTIGDAVEAGDAVLDTPPRECPSEIDPLTGATSSDGLADYLDRDSDNDGLGDREELAIGTDPCNLDTDGDGLGDLAEGAYQIHNCPPGSPPGSIGCGCATDASCSIDPDYFYVVLPYQGLPAQRNLTFDTSIRSADVFFLIDSTASMGGILANVQSTIARVGGLVDQISDSIPDAWFGGGATQDFPFEPYGSPGDEPFTLVIPMTPVAGASAISAGFGRLFAFGGNDGPEAQTEGLYQLMSGEGGTWTYGASSYSLRAYSADCAVGWGAPCFRDPALPIVVFFTDACAHEGPHGEDPGCDSYAGIAPPPHTWMQAIAQMGARGAKFVGIAVNSPSCTGTVAPDGQSPCYFLTRTAQETGSVDLDGVPLVYNLPASGESDRFVSTIASAVDAIATRVPFDLDTRVRDDPSDGIDASRFVERRQPACHAIPPAPRCWEEPPGLQHDEAVSLVDDSTFFGVIPGTRVTFRITFQNDFVPGGEAAQVFLAYIDVRAGGSTVIDTRQVWVLVPAGSSLLP